MRIETEHLVIREFPSHLKSVEEVDTFTSLVKEKFNIDERKMADIHLALTEAVNNAMIHGNYLKHEKTVIMSCIKYAHRITFTIKDEGIGFDMNTIKNPTDADCVEEPNGRGLFLIHRLADKVTFSDKGRVIDIEYILCSDDYLLAINEKHLNHHDYTDVITFNLSKDVIDAEVYISVDRADENASKRGIELQDEIHRLMAHGLLHLSGMNDATEKEKEEMRIAEDESLELLKKMFHVKP